MIWSYLGFIDDGAPDGGFDIMTHPVLSQLKDTMMEKCLEMAGTMAAMSPVAIQGTKVNLNYSRDHGVQEGKEIRNNWCALGQVCSYYCHLFQYGFQKSPY